MPNKIVKIVGLEYSGTTLTDLLVSTLNDNHISLGEIERSVGQEHAKKNFICACGRSDCVYWKNRSLEYPVFLEELLKITSIVDSSKTRSSINLYLPSNSIVIFIYKSCFSWCASCLSRYFILEVRPWRSSNPLKYVVPFIRIEILRRFVVFLPFEWLVRNILLMQFAMRAANSSGCTFYSTSLDNLLSIYDGHVIQNDGNHILRGNKISRKESITVRRLPRKRYQLFDSVFGSVLHLFAPNELKTLIF